MGNDSGNFPVLAISSFDNELWGKLNDVFCGTLSTEEISTVNDATIYPNPSDGNFFLSGYSSHQEFELVLFDQSGRKVFQSQVSNGNIAANHLENGIYSAFIQESGYLKALGNKIVILK
jgi:hypothetical protein